VPGRHSIQTRLRQEHEALQRELERTEALAAEYRRQGLQLLGPLEAQVKALLEQLRKYTDWEAQLPGEPRFARKHREHCELLEDLVGEMDFDARPPAMLSTHVAAIAGLLHREFLEEERQGRGEAPES